MTLSNLKCKGCGQILNNTKNSIGYTPKLTSNPKLCQRCFQFKYYNKPFDSDITIANAKEKIDNLIINDEYIFLIVDVLFLKTSLVNLSKYKIKKLFIIVNKIDCLPKKFNTNITLDFINKTLINYGYTNYEIIYTSIKNNNSIKRLNKLILGLEKNTKKIFIGKSNTGKTSLINALLKLNNEPANLTSSHHLNTTLDFKKIKLNKTYIIDTPGFIDENNILNFIGKNHIKTVICSKMVNKNFYLCSEQALVIEKLAGLILEKTESKSNVTIYLNSNLNVKRVKKENILKHFDNDKIQLIKYNIDNKFKTTTFELDTNKKHNIIIHGLCLISINEKVSKFSVMVNKNVKVELVDYAII